MTTNEPPVMLDTRQTYTEFHRRKNPPRVYPSEWVVRTFLGTYPRMSIAPGIRPGARVLDVGFGDGRNMPLLHDIGLEIHGVETTPEIVALTEERMRRYQIPVNLRIGSNVSLPYAGQFFDYLLASSSCYYVDGGATFSDNLREYARVLKPGGWLVASLPEPNTFILEDSVDLGGGHRRITKDSTGLREGYVFRVFQSEREVEEVFSPFFEQFSFGLTRDDYYGHQVNVFLLVCRRREPSPANRG